MSRLSLNRAISLLILLSLSSIAAGAGSPAPPRAVAVFDTSEGTFVAWVPDPSTPQGAYYKVYGLGTQAPVILGETDPGATMLQVEAGFTSYGVSTVVGTEESPYSTPCFEVLTSKSPPEVVLGVEDCLLRKLAPALDKTP